MEDLIVKANLNRNSKMKKKKYYTLFVTEESNYHCERMVATYEAEENSNPKDLFDLFLQEQHEKNTSYVVEAITTSDSPVEIMPFTLEMVDELTHDPSNRLGELA